MSESDTGPISIDDLLHHKVLEPLSLSAIDTLTQIENLNVTGFTEAEVRAYVIDPIVQILGYHKGSIFSADLERKIRFLDKLKFIDYKMTLWRENFWIIEAKKAAETRLEFGYRDFSQALEYAVHPEINAALIVLCDGNIFEVFDRETSVTEPVLYVQRTNLIRDFDKIRALLGPWQIWFFEKRRVARLIDKVFNREFNLTRVDEFRMLVERRLDGKRLVILDNYRSQTSATDAAEQKENHLKTADTAELVDVHFFLPSTGGEGKAMVDALVGRCSQSSFTVLHKIFPDRPRDANDWYYAHALQFLMALRERRLTVEWLPSWLGNGRVPKSVDVAIRHLIQLCLTQFQEDETRKIILLFAAAFRRVFKLLSVISEDRWRLAHIQHVLTRYTAPELSWAQIVSSPGSHVLSRIDGHVIFATAQFVRECQSAREEFQPEIAKLRLKELWEIEKGLLTSVPDYRKLLTERNLGEVHPTERRNVNYDFLGHSCLCVIESNPTWKSYVLQNHYAKVEELAALDSWQAKRWLEPRREQSVQPMNDESIAARFFFGDRKVLDELRSGYGFAAAPKGK